MNINPYLAYVSILYPLEIPEKFSHVYGGYKIETLAKIVLKIYRNNPKLSRA